MLCLASPLALRQFLAQARRLAPLQGLQWLVAGEPTSAMVVIAQGAFGHFNHSHLKKLMFLEGVAVSPLGSFVDGLYTVLKLKLPALADDTIFEIIGGRGIAPASLPMGWHRP